MPWPPPHRAQYLPMRLCLGTAQLMSADFVRAARTFRRELYDHPRSPAAITGLSQALRLASAFVPAERKAELKFATADFEQELVEDAKWAFAQEGVMDKSELMPCFELRGY